MSIALIDPKRTLLETLKVNLENDYDCELSQEQIQKIYQVFEEVIQGTNSYEQRKFIDHCISQIPDRTVTAAISWLARERLGKYDETNPIKIEPTLADRTIESIKETPPDDLDSSRNFDRKRGVFISKVDYIKPVVVGNQELWLEGKKLRFTRINGKNPPKDTMWMAEKTTGDRYVWRSICQVDKLDLKKLMNFLLANRENVSIPSIHVNSGTHGDARGQGADQGNIRLVDRRIREEARIALAQAFQEQEIPPKFTANKISLHSVGSYTPNIYPEEADHIIDSQCKGAHSMIPKTFPGLEEDLMFLADPSQKEARATQGCSSASSVAVTPQPQAVSKPTIAFGAAEWATYFGDVGVEPPLPTNIEQILSSPCIFWPGQKVDDTHLLVLIPNTVNGRPFHLNSLAELIKKPRKGNKTQYRYYNENIQRELGEKSFAPHWVLMTRDVIPDSRNKTYKDQKALVQRNAQQSGISYELPTALEATTAILMEYVKTGNPLYTDNKLGEQWTYTRCIEKVDKDQWPAAIGGFSSGGLRVDVICFDRFDGGVGCVRKF